jgi:hypothetical protein
MLIGAPISLLPSDLSVFLGYEFFANTPISILLITSISLIYPLVIIPLQLLSAADFAI